MEQENFLRCVLGRGTVKKHKFLAAQVTVLQQKNTRHGQRDES
jgi:hypothetical protein